MTMATSSEEPVVKHPIFVRDPADLLEYVYKEVCVLTEDGEAHTGWVYAVDPVSQTLALVRFSESNTPSALHLLMGHAVQKVTVLDEDASAHKEQLDSLFGSNMKSAKNFSKEELLLCKNRLKSWLLKNRLPVQESAEDQAILSVSDALFIEAPYGFENCRSTNEIILGRVQGLIKSMPPDIDEW